MSTGLKFQSKSNIKVSLHIHHDHSISICQYFYFLYLGIRMRDHRERYCDLQWIERSCYIYRYNVGQTHYKGKD